LAPESFLGVWSGGMPSNKSLVRMREEELYAQFKAKAA
jgi:hypothetical protein